MITSALGCTSAMASDLIAVACSTLESTSDPALKAAAVDALLSAMNEGVPLPSTAAWLIWSFWIASPACRAWRHANRLGEIPDDLVRAGAVAVLDRNDSEEVLRDLAVDVLVGPAHAAHLPDRFLLGLIERVRTGERAREAVRLIEAVHAARGVGVAILRMIRDRWSTSDVATIREASIAMTGEIAEPDLAFVEKMLCDPDAEVRSTMAFEVERDFPGRELALGAIEARLRIEVHPRVRAALLRAQAALVDDQNDNYRRCRRR